MSIFRMKPTQVYFAKIDGENGLFQQQIIRSNFFKAGRVYLFNAPPGMYVAVGTFVLKSMPDQSSKFTTFFSKELVEQSKVMVRENDFVFMGSYVVDTSVGLDGADDVQTHYQNVIAPGAATGWLAGAFLRDNYYRGTLLESKNDGQARDEFFQNSKDDLEGSAWAALIK